MWSVVHLPLALSRIGSSMKSLPSQAGNGSSSCRRSLSGIDDDLDADSGRRGGAMNPSSPASNPARRQFLADGLVELDALDLVGARVDVERARRARTPSPSRVT